MGQLPRTIVMRPKHVAKLYISGGLEIDIKPCQSIHRYHLEYLKGEFMILESKVGTRLEFLFAKVI